MPSVKTVQLTDAEIEAQLKSLGIDPTSPGRPSGISSTVVAAASGAIPESALPQTFNSVVLDRSGSMADYVQWLVDAYNQLFLASMKKAVVAQTTMVGLSLCSDDNYGRNTSTPDEALSLLYAATPLELVPDLTASDYNPDGYTPLCDAIGSQIKATVGYVETMVAQGVSIQAIMTMFSDGLENASRVEKPSSIRNKMVRLLDTPGYIPVFIGFGRTTSDKRAFEQFALACGYPQNNILAVGDHPDDEDARKALRRIFKTLSEKTVGVSKSIAGAANNQFFS